MRSARRWFARALLCGVMAGASLPGGVLAGPAGAQGDDFIYEVEPGDTLIGLAARYMAGPDGWRLLQSVNRVPDPYRLVPGSRIRIPLSQIPVTLATARVSFVRGQVRADGAPLRAGATLAESARIETGADGTATLELPDGSRVVLPPSTTAQVRRLRKFSRSGLTDTVIGVEHGAAESRVAPNGGGVGRYEMRTPLMVTGVRGTRYRVTADAEGSRSEVLEGKVSVGAGRQPGNTVAVAAGYGVGVSPAGRVSSPAALLPAPVVAPVPMPVLGASVTVRWSPVKGAVAYRVGVTRDAALTEWISSGQVDAPEAMLSGLPEGPLYLVVNAIAQDQLTGLPGVRPITVRLSPPSPFTLAPQPDGTQHGGPVTFRWAGVDTAAGYELAVAADKAFTQHADISRMDVAEARHTLPIGQWWWRVRSIDAQGQPGPWGESLAIAVAPAPPAPAPEDDGRTLRVRWPAGAAGAAAQDGPATSTGATGYVVQMSADAGFASDVVTRHTASNDVTLPRPAPGTYYVRVARDAGRPVPPTEAFSAAQRIDILQVLRDARGSAIVMGGEGHGVRLGVQ